MMKNKLALIVLLAAATSAQAVVTNVLQVGGDPAVRDYGWSGGVTNSAVSPVEYTRSFGAPAKYEALSNVVFTVTAVADNTLDALVIAPSLLAVDSSAWQTDASTNRLNSTETITLTFSYEDPDNMLLGLKMDAIGVYYSAGATEVIRFTDGSAVYDIASGGNSELFAYDTTGLLQLDLSNTTTWSMQVSANSIDTTGGMGAFKIEYIADTEFVPDPVIPAHGEVEFSEVWEGYVSTSNMALLAQSSEGFSAVMTNSAAKRHIYKIGADSFEAPFQVGELATWSFTATIGSALPLNPGDDFFQGSLWDAGITDGTDDNGVTFQVDWGTPSGDTMKVGSSKCQGRVNIGKIAGAVTTADVPSNALDAQGDSADFVVTIERTTETNIALSITYDDVTLTTTRPVPANFDSLDELGFRFKQSGDNHLIISNMKLVITSSDFDYYDDWATTKGLDAGNSAPGLDPDEDGMDNLLEYALGGDPLVKDPEILPTENADGGFLNMVYARRVDADARGLNYTVSSSLDLVFGPITNATEEAGTAAIVGNPDFEAVTNRVPTTSEAKQFMQLKVSK